MSSEQVGIKIIDEGNVSIVFVSGELTLLDAPELKQAVDKIILNGRNRLIFDFENLTFLDSSGVGLLLRFHAQLRKASGKLAFIHFHKSVANTMQKALPQQIRETAYFETKEKAFDYVNS